MIPIIEQKREQIGRLCRKYRVKRFELFGWAAEGRQFDAQQSDLDFLVEFLALQSGQHADMYSGLLESLQELFDRSVDLVVAGAIRNHYFLEKVNQTRTMLYAA
ncbi:MAG TPA: nucleotidyltransferase domain-containing protein [Acidobacteriota bacterium]|jgi:hypothetical protein